MTLFDGLNRFYVAEGEDDLAAALSVPASVVDLFEKAPVRALSVRFAELRSAEADALTAKANLEQARLEIAALEVGLADLTTRLVENVERQRWLQVELDRRDVALDDRLQELRSLEIEAIALREGNARLNNELRAIERTKVMRYSKLPRLVYRWTRRKLASG
jgi:hypothetical protein